MFRIEWLQTALNELTTIWTNADSSIRTAITEASHRIDEELQENPEEEGESRPEGRRIAFFPPLGILFRVEEDQQSVAILRVWLFRHRDS